MNTVKKERRERKGRWKEEGEVASWQSGDGRPCLIMMMVMMMMGLSDTTIALELRESRSGDVNSAQNEQPYLELNVSTLTTSEHRTARRRHSTQRSQPTTY